jgi:SAM-dependent methyltransferase
MTLEKAVAEHYGRGGLSAAIDAVLARLGLDSAQLTTADLAPIDEFHIGGREATAKLFDRVELAHEHRVLDVGAGLGGPARYVAERFGCDVVGIDVTAEYCDVATSLTERLGLAERARFQQASALDMPFADAAFDTAYTIHVAMNIADKAALYREVRRVLRPGGPFVVYDVLGGPDDAPLRFPVPWADGPDTSFLVNIDELTALLSDAGFEIQRIEDRTEFALDFFRARLAKVAADGPPPLGFHMLMGGDFADKMKNMLANLEAGRIAPFEVICRRP